MKVCPSCAEYFANETRVCPLCQAELRKTNDPYLGRTIAGRYRVLKRLGGGGTATVYLARHVMIDRLCAIKVLRQDLSLNPTHRERFVREARAVNRINHPNIVEISDVGEMDGVAYLVMEYVDGQSLHARAQRRRAAVEAAPCPSRCRSRPPSAAPTPRRHPPRLEAGEHLPRARPRAPSDPEQEA